SDLSFWERRGGTGATIATAVWVPPMAFDSEPERVEAILAPAAYDEAARGIVATLGSVRTVTTTALVLRAHPLAGLRATLVRPAAGSAPTGTAMILRLDGERVPAVRKAWIGDGLVFDRSTAVGLAASAREMVIASDGSPEGRRYPLRVVVALEGGPPVAVAEIDLARV